MPEAVRRHADGATLDDVRAVQRDLLELIRADFSKHAPPLHLARIWQVWDSIPHHLAQENKKFVWGAVRPGARARDFELALQWLIDYGVAYPVARLSRPGVPLSAYAEPHIMKLFGLDVGLIGALSGLDVATAVAGDAVFREFRGALAEQFVHQQLTARGGGGHYGPRLYYWAGKAAEIDFVRQFGAAVVPIEVKAGEARRSQSLRSYTERFAPAVALRASPSPYRVQDTLTNVPLYAVEEMAGVVESLTRAPEPG
jgi:hypothetical protein